MLCNKQIQQPNAINKPDSILPISTSFYRSRWLEHATARPALIPSAVAPGSEKPECPVFQPRDRGEVFWNTTLLSIEQTSFLLLHEYEYKVSDITINNLGTATLRRLPLLFYASSRTTRCSGRTLVAEQRRRWWTPLRRDSGWNTYPSSLERKPRQAIKKSQHDLQTGLTHQVSTLNVLASSQ